MGSWSEFEEAAPELASRVRERFDKYGLGLLATIRKDGSPRICPVEPLFAMDELWLGSMPGSRKADDLRRDPRFAIHCATADKHVTEGDAKISGRALLIDDDATRDRFLQAFEAQNGYAPPPGPFPLFRADVSEVSMLSVAGDHLEIDIWREGQPVRRVDRF